MNPIIAPPKGVIIFLLGWPEIDNNTYSFHARSIFKFAKPLITPSFKGEQTNSANWSVLREGTQSAFLI